jgi:hypothetical protein
MWKEAAASQFDILDWHLPGGIEEDHGNFSQDSRCPGRDSNPASPGYKSEVLPIELTCSV